MIRLLHVWNRKISSFYLSLSLMICLPIFLIRPKLYTSHTQQVQSIMIDVRLVQNCHLNDVRFLCVRSNAELRSTSVTFYFVIKTRIFKTFHIFRMSSFSNLKLDPIPPIPTNPYTDLTNIFITHLLCFVFNFWCSCMSILYFDMIRLDFIVIPKYTCTTTSPAIVKTAGLFLSSLNTVCQ